MTDAERARYTAELERLAATTPADYARELLEEGAPELAAVKRVRARYGLGVRDALELVRRVHAELR